MMPKRQVAGIEIGETIFQKRFYIKHLASGKTFYPDDTFRSQLSVMLDEIFRRTMSDDQRTFVLEYMVKFALAALVSPESYRAALFLRSDAKTFVEAAEWSDGSPRFLWSIGPDAFGRRLDADSAHSERFHDLFRDDTVALSFNAGSGFLRACSLTSSRQVFATSDESNRHRELIALARAAAGHDEPADASLIHRTIARALLSAPHHPLRLVLFGQTAEVAYQVIISAKLE